MKSTLSKNNSRPPGGVMWIAGNTNFISEQFRKDLSDFDARRRGLEVGRMTQPHSAAPISDESERSLKNLGDRACATLSGIAQDAYLKALDAIRMRPVDLNAAAMMAKVRNNFKAARRAVIEKSRPIAVQVNQTQGELNLYLQEHRRGPLAEGDYLVDATMKEPLLWSASAVAVDAVLNATQYVPVMPGGVPQALIIAIAMSGGMALAGAPAGTAIRYWYYADRARRWAWRFVGTVATLVGLAGASLFAQYRAVLENVARVGGEPSLAAIVNTPPTIMSVTVFIAALGVFLFTGLKFRVAARVRRGRLTAITPRSTVRPGG